MKSTAQMKMTLELSTTLKWGQQQKQKLPQKWRPVPPLYIPDPKLSKSDQKQTKFHSKSDLNQTNFDFFPDQIQEKQTKTGLLVMRQLHNNFYLVSVVPFKQCDHLHQYLQLLSRSFDSFINCSIFYITGICTCIDHNIWYLRSWISKSA